MNYYIKRKLHNGGLEYVSAPKGWRWTEQVGPVKESHHKGAPETSLDPYKRYLFKSKRAARIQANMIPGSEIVTTN